MPNLEFKGGRRQIDNDQQKHTQWCHFKCHKNFTAAKIFGKKQKETQLEPQAHMIFQTGQ